MEALAGAGERDVRVQLSDAGEAGTAGVELGERGEGGRGSYGVRSLALGFDSILSRSVLRVDHWLQLLRGLSPSIFVLV